MRRVAFISDLHANLVALDAVLADIDALGVTDIVCLGDIIDLGPEPNALLDRLDERGVRCIQGNHDPLDEHPSLANLREIEDWTRDQIGPERLEALTSLPTELELDLDGVRVLCVHGSPAADTDQILATTARDRVEGWLQGRSFDVLVGGHTHVQLVRRLDARIIVNVGSVGMPFARPMLPGPNAGPPEILPWCEYGLISGAAGRASVELRQVALDVEAYVASVRRAGFPDPDDWIQHWQ